MYFHFAVELAAALHVNVVPVKFEMRATMLPLVEEALVPTTAMPLEVELVDEAVVS